MAIKTSSGADPKQWSVKSDSGDPLLSVLPLRDAGRMLAAELIRDGYGKFCGECGRQFNAARKWRGIARVNHVDMAGGFFSTAWLLCGRCHADMMANGNRVSDKLIREAREACEAGQLMLAPAKGSA